MILHTFGDSHSLNGWCKISNVQIHPIGPVLCYSFGRDKLNRLDITKYPIKSDDWVIFCFGEIDCRCHIHKNMNVENPYDKMIESIVKNYFEAIKANIDNIENIGKVCVYNVVPPVEKHTIDDNPEYTCLGTDEDRKKYVLYFNSLLKKYCIDYNYVFIDVYDSYCDKNGFLDKELSDGNVHINSQIHLEKFIKSLV